MDINFELYKIFYHAAKLESFSEAGKRLFITQSAVSQAIKNLEEKLGSPLFYRKSRSIKLTQEGELLLKHVDQAYNFIKTAENKILEIQSLNQGEIRIGASDTVCKYHLIPYMEQFNKVFPKVKINVINRTSAQILEILKNGQIDFGIVTLPVTEKNIKVIPFTNVEDIFVACSKFSNLKNSNISLRELSNFPLLMLPESSSTRQVLNECLKKLKINISPEIELESVDLLVEFSKIGLGIAYVLKESAEELISKGELFKIQISDTLPLRKLGIVIIENVPLSHASAEFIKMLQNTV
ncbi:MAG: transcriptional regulator [Clostridiales bacterium]|nr:transcriptional regulator [Clostridiales bacterium]